LYLTFKLATVYRKWPKVK